MKDMIRLLYILLSITVVIPVSAQDSLLLRDYTFIKQRDPWLNSPNAAALTRYDYQNMAQAELSLGGERGGFTNYYGSDDITHLNAGVESFYRFSPSTVFFGGMSYENASGRHMAGSAFINPERRPFDLVEDSLTNQGTKHLDTYHLTGGFGCTVANGFSVGMKLDFTAANYAKYKDLRHQNKLMDLQVTAGIYAPVTSWLGMGAHYQYHRNTESITFGTYGTSDKVYKTLVSYANFTGHLEQFGQEGHTDKSHEMPLVTDCNGLGVQFSIQNSPFSIFASYDYVHGWGYYGRKSPYTITYTEHHTDRHQFHVQVAHQISRTSTHRLDLAIDLETLQNDANTYRELQNASGATYYAYYTPVKTANKQWQDYRLAYTLQLGIREAMPTWTIEAAMNWMKRKQTAYIFPYYRRQNLHNTEGTLAVSRNIIANKGVWTVSLFGSYLKGGGAPYEDLTFQTPSDKQTVPPSMDAYLYREYLYLTAAQFSIGGNVKYAFVFPATRLKTYAKVSLAHRKANETNMYSNGQNRTQATLAIGCEF